MSSEVGQKPSILLISYYFDPSPEVGARRPSETARYLLSQGHPVHVIRAVGHGDASRMSTDICTSTAVRVPRKLVTRVLLRIKSMLRPARTRGSDAAASSPSRQPGEYGPDSATRVRRRGFLPWLRRQYLALDTSFQGNKLWLLKVILKVYSLRMRQRFDIVIASGPPFVSQVAGRVARRINNASLVLDFRDPWYLHGDPERKTEIAGHPIANWENRQAQRCISASSLIAVASPGTGAHCRESFDLAGTRIELIRNGYDDAARIDEPPPVGRLLILYAGSLYWNRNPFPFLQALETCLQDGQVDAARIRFTLVGDCADWEGTPLQPWLDAHEMQDAVKILPAVGPDELRRLVTASNLLINFAQGQPRQIPAKSYEYIASGRDQLIIAEPDGDLADLVREAGVGKTVSPDDISGMKDAILGYYREYADDSERRAVAASELSQYGRAAQLARFGELLNELDGGRDTRVSGN